VGFYIKSELINNNNNAGGEAGSEQYGAIAYSAYKQQINYKFKKQIMSKKTWDIILKAIIAVASAILGALGANAMTL